MSTNGLSIATITPWSGDTLPGGDFGSGIGVNAECTVTGTPAGAVSFVAARTPVYLSATAVSAVNGGEASIGGVIWFLTLPDVGGWYVWVLDGATPCAECGAVWAGDDGTTDLLMIGEQLRDILLANAKLLNAAMANTPMYDNDGNEVASTLKQVAVISPLGIAEFPSIAIDEMRYTSEFAFVPWGKEMTYSARITFIIVHPDEQVAGKLVAQFMRAGAMILNQPAYETITLASGLAPNFCQCTTGFVSEADAAGEFVAMASADWSGKALKQGGDW